jgi:hypothetical protein
LALNLCEGEQPSGVRHSALTKIVQLKITLSF